MRSKKQVLLVLMVLLMFGGSASGQFNGENIEGDNGLNSGSQAPPGTYLTNLSYFYDSSEIKLPNRTIELQGGINIFINVTAISRVTKKKFLGANYGVQLAIPGLITE